MSRIRQKLTQLQKQGKKAFIPYLTYAFPSRRIFREIFLAVAGSGVDIIEVGMPFSDPVADGPVIQRSSQLALQNGATLPDLLNDLQQLRRQTDIPVALMTYYNPVFYMGEERFCQKARGVIDALVVPDLLPEEAAGLINACRKNLIDTVFFIAPTTDPKRYELIDKDSSGFIYYVSVTGTTGMRREFNTEIFKKINAVKRKVKAPLCVGFGISSRGQVVAFGKVSDGVIVGSAIIKFIDLNWRRADFIPRLITYINILRGRK